MSRLKSTTEPMDQSNTIYDIRDKVDWDSVYDTLDSARQKYHGGDGSKGKIRNLRRKIADNISPGAEAAKIGAKVVPQDHIATPVLGAVEVLFEAVKTAASVRNEALTAFDGLVPIFSDVELFLGTFQGDTNIRNASIELTTTTLIAVEQAIGFFISNEIGRVVKAVFRGADYEKGLKDSLEMIQSKSRDLMQQALKSHMFEAHMTHIYSLETRKLQAQLDAKVSFVAQGTVAIADVAVQGFNAIEKLMNDHLKQKDDHLRQKDLELEAIRQEMIHLRVENVKLRSTSPVQSSMWLPPSQPTQGPIRSLFISQEALRNILDAYNVDVTDLAFVHDKKAQLPSRDRSRAEQITNTLLFRNWIVSASSAKLLIQWDTRLPKIVAEVSPLSVFCLTLVQALRTNTRFISTLWFCGQHTTMYGLGAPNVGQAMISSLLEQLLRQWRFDTELLHNEINVESLQNGEMDALTALLGFLVRQLPREVTLFFVIDGAVLYERDEALKVSSPVFFKLFELGCDARVMASMKLLITSTPGTHYVRGGFEEDDLILNVDSLPVLAVASEERMIRELEGGLY
ncbi:hypothetical protein SLS60_001351 [Paraconiothyrium brasiliense]|uniref:Uncharacterized protein n=1 Tax=Paraconiothyrium brasiliense TaxID=300254 RepID=A0ABR3S8X4_9PLEO